MQNWKRLLTAAAATAALTTCAVQVPLSAQGRGRGAQKKEDKAQATDRETPRWSMPGRVIPQKYEEPAFARGFEAGRERGQADAAKGERYDPVASRDIATAIPATRRRTDPVTHTSRTTEQAFGRDTRKATGR